MPTNEVPELVATDPRIGQTAICPEGTGKVEHIYRFEDGTEIITIVNESTGRGCVDSADHVRIW